MHELLEIQSAAAHQCATPRIERWRVYEPVSARWSWLTVFLCCNQVHEEIEAADTGVPASAPIRKAA